VDLLKILRMDLITSSSWAPYFGNAPTLVLYPRVTIFQAFIDPPRIFLLEFLIPSYSTIVGR
jgi:hypothetical protein